MPTRSPGWSGTRSTPAPERWLGLALANAGLTVIEYRPALPPSLTVLNELSHLPPELRWTGFPDAPRP